MSYIYVIHIYIYIYCDQLCAKHAQDGGPRFKRSGEFRVSKNPKP